MESNDDKLKCTLIQFLFKPVYMYLVFKYVCHYAFVMKLLFSIFKIYEKYKI